MLIQAAMTVAPALEAVVRSRRERDADDAVRDAAAELEALQHAWQAFEFQARQRALTLGAFLFLLAVLAVAYTLALTGDLPTLAAILGVVGVIAVLFFNRFDAVHRSQLHAAERGLGRLQERLAAAAGAPEIVLAPGGTARLYHDALILSLQVFCFFGFICAFLYALITA
jgi:hypothetical protein